MTLARFVLLSPLAVVALAACGEKDTSSGDDTAADTASEIHPLVPEGYEYRWDTDGCGDNGTGEAIYILAEASTDADGNFTATETWYHFYGGDRANDCVDTISYLNGTPVSQATRNDFNATEAEEGYVSDRTVTELNCSESYNEDEYIFIFDTLSPSGNLNYENAMLVFRYYEGRRGWVSDTDYATGVFNPESEVLGPPATYTWEAEFCDD